jgi:ADP-ribose pyrophosphatase YjhB (NUDIX family)
MSTSWRIAVEPAVTPVFRLWWKARRGTTLGVRALATDESGRVLLVRHTYRRGWFLPGGGVESGETAHDAVARELAEEGGVEALSAPRLMGFYANHAAFKNDHVVLFRVEDWRACAPRDNGEIAERGFFAREALPEGVTRGTLRRLAEHFDGAEISATW